MVAGDEELMLVRQGFEPRERPFSLIFRTAERVIARVNQNVTVRNTYLSAVIVRIRHTDDSHYSYRRV
jgi:hypothetical protein